MLNLQLQNVGNQLNSADGSELNIKSDIDVWIYSTKIVSTLVLQHIRTNILRISGLIQLYPLAVVNVICSDEFNPVKSFLNHLQD